MGVGCAVVGDLTTLEEKFKKSIFIFGIMKSREQIIVGQRFLEEARQVLYAPSYFALNADLNDREALAQRVDRVYTDYIAKLAGAERAYLEALQQQKVHGFMLDALSTDTAECEFRTAMDTSLQELCLVTRVKNSFASGGYLSYERVGHVVSSSISELMKLKNFGRRGLNYTIRVMAELHPLCRPQMLARGEYLSPEEKEEKIAQELEALYATKLHTLALPKHIHDKLYDRGYFTAGEFAKAALQDVEKILTVREMKQLEAKLQRVHPKMRIAYKRPSGVLR